MTLSVFAPENALIVTSTEATFLEVKTFVEEMDERAAQRVTVMAREQFIYTPPAVLQQTLNSMLGPAARITTNRGATQTQFGGGGGAFGGGGMGGVQQRPMGAPIGTTGGGTFGGGAFGGGGNIGGAIQQRIGAAVGGGGGGTGAIGGAQQRPGGAVGGGAIGGGGAQQRPMGAIGGGR